MASDDGFDALVTVCIELHEEVMKHGSPTMQTASRLLLHALAEEIRRREQAGAPTNDDEP